MSAQQLKLALREVAAGLSPGLLEAFRVIRSRNFEILPPRRTYAQGTLHECLKRRFNYRGGFFLEAGANNGIFQSNTAYLERYLGWKGILIEAIPHKFVECLRNRPYSLVYHYALVPNEFPAEYVKLKYCNAMSIVSDNKNHESAVKSIDAHVRAGKKHLLKREPWGVEFFAPAKTLSQVIEEAGNPHLDFMSLDVEGFEYSALRGLDFEKHRPSNILIEAIDGTQITHFLNGKGYSVLERPSNIDILFAAS